MAARLSLWINAFFIGYLIRAGIQVLGSYPRLYWNDDSRPGHEWLTLTRRKIPTNRVWTSLEQELNVPPWLGHPGGNNLGLGRIWHFFALTLRRGYSPTDTQFSAAANATPP